MHGGAADSAGGIRDEDLVVLTFAAACEAGSVSALRDLLAADASVVTDTGRSADTAVQPLRGADECARFVVDLLSQHAGATLTLEAVNGRTGVAVRRLGQLVAMVTLGVVATKIVHVWIVLNPDKLRHWQHG
ncbi:hypothetical protein GCM10027053_42980 [Intrasporangium mesophilum]